VGAVGSGLAASFCVILFGVFHLLSMVWLFIIDGITAAALGYFGPHIGIRSGAMLQGITVQYAVTFIEIVELIPVLTIFHFNRNSWSSNDLFS